MGDSNVFAAERRLFYAFSHAIYGLPLDRREVGGHSVLWRAIGGIWRTHQDSNLRPPPPEDGAPFSRAMGAFCLRDYRVEGDDVTLYVKAAKPADI